MFDTSAIKWSTNNYSWSTIYIFLNNVSYLGIIEELFKSIKWKTRSFVWLLSCFTWFLLSSNVPYNTPWEYHVHAPPYIYMYDKESYLSNLLGGDLRVIRDEKNDYRGKSQRKKIIIADRVWQYFSHSPYRRRDYKVPYDDDHDRGIHARSLLTFWKDYSIDKPFLLPAEMTFFDLLVIVIKGGFLSTLARGDHSIFSDDFTQFPRE